MPEILNEFMSAAFHYPLKQNFKIFNFTFFSFTIQVNQRNMLVIGKKKDMQLLSKSQLRQTIQYPALAVLIVLNSCGGDDESNGPASLKEVSSLSIVDIANNNNASDIQVYLTQDQEGISVDEYRLILVKEDKASSFDVEAANNIPPASYWTITVDTTDLVVSSALKDADGDDVEEETSYVAFILSVKGSSGSKNLLSRPSSDLTLERKSAIRNIGTYFNAGSGGMDTDANGNILMGDFGASLNGTPGTLVYQITPSGEVSVFANGLVGASGNDFDSKGVFYQANIAGGTISKLTSTGSVSTFASNTLQSPVGITFDKDDMMYVANCGGNDISLITPSGSASKYVSSNRFNCPNGITVDNEGNLYVSNFGNGDVLRVTPDKVVTKLVTLPGGNNGHILFHNDLLWVVDRGGHAIYKVTTGGVSTKFAGNGSRGNKNGSLDKSSLSLPNDISFSPDGRFMYINDTDPSASGGEISPVIIRAIEIIED